MTDMTGWLIEYVVYVGMPPCFSCYVAEFLAEILNVMNVYMLCT